MSIVSTTRADYVRPNVRIGRKKKPKRIASDAELHQINQAIVKLNEAKQSINEPEFLVKVSDAMKLTRDIWRSRNE